MDGFYKKQLEGVIKKFFNRLTIELFFAIIKSN